MRKTKGSEQKMIQLFGALLEKPTKLLHQSTTERVTELRSVQGSSLFIRVTSLVVSLTVYRQGRVGSHNYSSTHELTCPCQRRLL
jgi:hypothetical protein